MNRSYSWWLQKINSNSMETWLQAGKCPKGQGSTQWLMPRTRKCFQRCTNLPESLQLFAEKDAGLSFILWNPKMVCFCYFCDLYCKLALTESSFVYIFSLSIHFFLPANYNLFEGNNFVFCHCVNLWGLTKYEIHSRSSINISLIYLHMYLFTYLK